MQPINYNERVLCVASTRSGKSVFARYLFEHFTGCRRTLIDVKDEHELGVEKARTPAELDLAAPVSHYVPSRLEDEEYEELFDRIWAAHGMGPRVTWLDEAYGPTRAGYAPRGLRFTVQQGGGKGQGLIVCSQRNANIEATLRTEASHVFAWDLTWLDIKTLAPDLGLEPEALRKALEEVRAQQGQYAHLWYARADKSLTRCAPLDPSWAHPAPLVPAGAQGGTGAPAGPPAGSESP